MRMLISAALLALGLAAPPAQSSAEVEAEEERACPVFFRESFLQPTTVQKAWSQHKWNRLFRDWRVLGIESLVLQWSRYDEINFYSGKTAPYNALLDRIFRAARNHDIQLILGLKYDPAFWERIEESIAHRAVYFEQRRMERAHLLEGLAHYTKHPNFAGWYLPDEIDDLNWRGPVRRAQLIAYLKNARRQISRHSPHPVSISSFSNGDLPADNWAAFWQEVLGQSGIDELYFQDGLGVGKLEPAEVTLYLESMAEMPFAAAGNLKVITELLEKEEQEDLRATSWSKLRQNMRLPAQWGLKATAFAYHPYLNPDAGKMAARLYRNYRKAWHHCTD